MIAFRKAKLGIPCHKTFLDSIEFQDVRSGKPATVLLLKPTVDLIPF
jgi:hypothetical protein